MSDRPAPLAERSLDVRGFEYMPLLGGRLFASEFYALAVRNPRGGIAAQKLWWTAWQQLPAGSLPANEYSLCTLADFGSDMRAWNRARAVAMHGFVLCNDGRYYHPTIVEVAQKAQAIREKARAKKASQRSKLAAHERHDDAGRQEHDVNSEQHAPSQAIVNAESQPVCPPGRPGSVPAEGKVREEKNSGSLRSPAAVAAGEGKPSSLVPDLLGHTPPAPEPKRPTAAAVLYGEGMAKLIEMTDRKRDPLAKWIGRMRKEGADDALILALVQDAHRRWLAQEGELADPIGWISATVKGRIAAAAGAKREVPDQAGDWLVKPIVDRCGDMMNADCEGAWPGFSVMLADALAGGADPERHVYPAMRAAVRKGIRSIESAGWFAFKINGFRTGVAA